MLKSGLLFDRNLLLLSGVLLGVVACATNQPAQHPATNDGVYKDQTTSNPTYYDNGSFDDNGVEPVPNNGNQNFGRRW